MGDRPATEREVLEYFGRVSRPPPPGETWIGDDTAVVKIGASPVLFATDSVVEGVHFLRGGQYLADAGWKALARNLSDVAAMGGVARYAVAAVSGAGVGELLTIREGLEAAAGEYSCPVVGGDVSTGVAIVVTVSIIGEPTSRGPVLRSGAIAGDVVYCTGPLGRSSAGLRTLLADPSATGPLVAAHRRPRPRLQEGRCAAAVGAHAMLDISDGLGIDLSRLADASGVGFTLDDLPIASGATEADALGGGDDYELVFAADPSIDVEDAFRSAHLDPPARIGSIVADPALRTLWGSPLDPSGWQHTLE